MGWRARFVLRAVLITVFALAAVKLVHAHEGHDHGAKSAAGNTVHAHTSHVRKAGYRKTVHPYILPDVPLVTAQGRGVRLLDVMAADGPLVMNFIFTSCTTTCPVMNQAMSGLPERLGTASSRLRLLSVSVDPRHDTPETLRAYAERYRTRAPWHFLTGQPGDIETVRTAFGHDARHLEQGEPLILLRPARGEPWLRIEGYASAEDLAREYRLVVKP